MKIIKKAVIVIFLTGILIGIVVTINSKEAISNEMPVRFLVIKSASMSPTLNVNDIVIIVKSNSYEIGDIISYQNDSNELITHRLIEKENGDFITKGDYNNSSDEKLVLGKNVIGKVVFVIDTKAKMIVAILTCIAIIFYILILLKRSKKEYEEKY